MIQPQDHIPPFARYQTSPHRKTASAARR